MAFEFKKFLLENKLTTGSKLKSLVENELSEESAISIDGKPVDVRSLEIDGIDTKDYPDFVDTYFSYGEFEDGTELTDDQLDRLGNENGDLINQMAHEHLHEGEEEDSMQDEPTAKDLKAGSKSTADLAKKQNQLAVLLKHKNEILDQYKKGQITIEQYKDKIGNIPQHIKNLTAQIEKATIADDQIDEYEMGDESNKLASYELVGVIIDKLEDHLEGGKEYTESQLHDVIADYVYDNPMSDKAAEELFFDVEEKLYDLGYVKAS
jgi:hypothetical protein